LFGQKYRRIRLTISGIMLASIAQAAPQIYTDQATFIAALPGTYTTLNFDSATAESVIPSASALGGVTFGYSLDGVQLKVSSVSSGYSTTSGAQFLGSDDAEILQDGDALTLSFAAVNAIGVHLISNDVLEDNDISLTAGGATASLLKTATQGAPLGDGSVIYFLGIIDDQVPFYTASLNTAGNTAFLFNVDDIVTVLAPDDDGDGVANVNDNCVLTANTNQRDTDGDGYGNWCDADLDNSGFVNFGDLAAFKAAFGTTDADADLDGSGFVNFGDLARFKALFGQPPGPSCCPAP
jgi:hypothetical protein